MTKKKNTSPIKEFDVDKALNTFKFFFIDPINEIIVGIHSRRFPFLMCSFATIWVLFIHILSLDYLFLKLIRLDFLYPYGLLWIPYKVLLIIGCFYLWGLYQGALKIRLVRKLTEVFTEAGLKSLLGRIPAFISDEPLDEDSRKLRIKLRGQSFKDIEGVKDRLANALQVHIDEVSENRDSGTVDVLYSYNELTDHYLLRGISELEKDEFVVGLSRAQVIKEKLSNVPHILIAGQTGGGKSTFLRQLITSLYLKNKDYSFELIDLKGGLEFQTFERLPRVKVVSNIQSAIKTLQNQADITLKERMELLKLNNCKDIESFLNIPEGDKKFPEKQKNKIDLARKVIVVDEAAEVFRVNSYATAQDIATARNSAAKIAAQGRALGVHLIVATQKPNVSSVDGNIKTNLTGRICFRMSDIASSNTILDNKRAAELSNIKGRAIWRSDSTLKEVQAPDLTEENAKSLLKKFYKDLTKYESKGDLQNIDEVADA